MGWKAFKEHFQIEHIVQIVGNELQIGSEYASNLAAINFSTGEVIESDTFPNFLKKYYPLVLQATANEILDLLSIEDQFTSFIPVFTYAEHEILEKYCEEFTFPNVTHDGILMFSNTFSTSKEKVIGWAKRDVNLALNLFLELADKTEKKLNGYKNEVERIKANQANLESDYPSIPMQELI